jgi:hypothetical protein
MGTEPTDDDTPPDIEDFPLQIQDTLNVYRNLRDIWDTMSGQYLGKDLSIIFNLFDLLEIEPADQKLVFRFIQSIDRIRNQILDSKKEKPSK